MKSLSWHTHSLSSSLSHHHHHHHPYEITIIMVSLLSSTYIHTFSGAPPGAFQQPVYNKCKVRWLIACAAAGLFVSNSGFNRLRISARHLVSNSAESHGNIESLLIGLFLPCVCSKSGFDQSEATIYLKLMRSRQTCYRNQLV